MEEKLIELIRLKNKYISVLQLEITRMTGFCYAHGQTTPSIIVNEASDIRDKIKKLESEIRSNTDSGT